MRVRFVQPWATIALAVAVISSALVATDRPASAAVASLVAAADDRTAVTSYDRMQPGAPHHSYFTSAWQSFVAQSDTITSLGVTVGTPNYRPDGHTVMIRLCADPSCRSVLAEARPQIINYGNTSADIGDVGVTPGSTYYIVWYQPAAWNGQSWVTYWWAGGSTITQSDQLQAIVRGYNRGPAIDRTAVTSYNKMFPGAPYHGYFTSAWQDFTAQSNTITRLGVTVGTPNYLPDGHTITIRLCTDTSCSRILGETRPQIINYGNSAGDIGDVSVTPGARYYIVWYQPAAWKGQSWVTYWWAGGPTITQSDQLQAIVQGYTRSTPVPPTYHVTGTGGLGLRKRSGPGLSYTAVGLLAEGAGIQIACQVRSTSAVGGSTIWDKLTDGAYVSDFYTDTPMYNEFTPGISRCNDTPPPPTNTAYVVKGTGGIGLKRRTGPGLGYPAVGALPEGATLAIACQYRSTSSVGGSTIWDQLADRTWVSDFYTSTPVFNGFSPGLSQCTSVPPPPSYEFPVRQSYGQPGPTAYGQNPTGLRSDPVNTLTGAYWTKASDFKLPGIGIPFELERSYTSIDTTPGPLGPGWTHSYNVSLAFNDKGDATIRTDQGAQLAFKFEPSGLFVGAPGVDATLRQVPTGFELIRHDQTHLRFDPNGHLQAVLDRNGQGLHMTVNPNGQLTAITDSADRKIAFTYDATSNLLAAVTLPDGRSVRYGYTGGRLTTVTDPGNGTTKYSYDDAGRLTSLIDANGHTEVDNTYGSDGRVTRQTDALGHVSTFAWDQASQTATMTDARGGVWKDVYDQGVLIERTDPRGNTTSYRYDGDLNQTAVTDPRGHQSGADPANYTTTYTYDERGNRTSETAPAPLGYKRTWTYDAQNNITGSTDGRGNTTTYGYDDHGNLISMTQPGGLVTRYGRDPAGTGLLVSQTDPLGKTTKFGYDSAGNRTSITSPKGEVTTMTYDAAGRMTSRVDPRGNQSGANPDSYRTRFAYDALDRPTSTTDPLGHTTTTAYDKIGNKLSTTDPKGHTTRFAYDAADHLIKVTAATGAATAYRYEPTGNLTARTDANGHTTAYEYDGANQLVGQTDPAGHQTSYRYDPAGNLTTTQDPKGITTANKYDALNRRTSTSYSDGTPTVTLSYDANGNRTALTDRAGTQTYTYDPLNQLTKVSRGANVFAYTYNAGGHLTSRTYPGSAAIGYSYDDNGQLATVTANGGTASYTYDAAGNRTALRLPASNGYTETRSYDPAGQITRVKTASSAGILTDYAYTRDAAGNPTKVVGTDGTVLYTYDPADRLTKVCFTTTCSSPNYIRWTYDGVGNRLAEYRSATPTMYKYDAADRLLSTTKGTTIKTYAYDAAGNQTKAGTRSFTYDATHHITSTTAPTATGTSTISFLYDGDGNRLRRTAGTSVTNYLWDTNGELPQLALERNAKNALLRRYTYGNELFAQSTLSTTYYLTGDQLSSITGVTSATGAGLLRYSYEPFGKTRTTTKLVTTGSPNTQPMRFNAQYLDSFGLYNLRAREYDPTIGRFTGTDPVEQEVGDPYVASYVYGRNRPTVLTDPTGRFAVVPIVLGAYFLANLAQTGVNCYYASKTYDSGFGGEFQRDCSFGLGGLALQAFGAGPLTTLLGRYGDDVVGLGYDAITALPGLISGGKRPSSGPPTAIPPAQPSSRPSK
jgi:RHS repeat-associated protein